MPEREVFPNAPITEALIDLRVVLDGEGTSDRLAKVVERLSADFPSVEKKMQMTFAFKPGEEPKAATNEAEHIGNVMRSEDRERVVQARLNGFTYSKLKPYLDWDDLLDNTRRLWETYRDITKPKKVVRLASRFINRIELPLAADFDDYFRTNIQIADGLPQGISEQFCRIVVPKPESSLTAIITTTLEKPNEDREFIPYIFDIDVFKIVDYDADADTIWEDLTNIRDYKDDIIFFSTTDQCKALFR